MRSEEGQSSFIGHIIISEDRPARPTDFWIAIERRDASVEVGSIVTVKGEDNIIIGVVDDIRYASRSSSVAQFYEGQTRSEGQVQPSLKVPIERYAHVRVLAASPPYKMPPHDRWPVRHAVYNDIEVLFGKIPKRCRVLAGFLKGRQVRPIPVYLHADFLLGREGAHINITGKTGLATKTSYAVFLAYSVLSWAKQENQRVAVVMFNVKRGDLMRLHRLPRNMEEARSCIKDWARAVGMEARVEDMVKLWESALEEGLDPFSVKIRYFTYSEDPYQDENHEDTWYFSYGLADLSVVEVIASIYRPGEKVTDPQYAMIHTYFDSLRATERKISFNEMKEHFSLYSRYKPDEESKRLLRKKGAPDLESWRTDVADAIFRRLCGFLSRATHIVEVESPEGQPIKFWDQNDQRCIAKGKINVIQLFGLDEAEKRLVVNAVLRELLSGLQKPRDERHVDRIMVFVDELNLYAPKAESPIKEQIIDIVARGRDLGLSLFGAQQFASQIDLQVLGNCSTKVVGNTDYAEVKKDLYAYLGEFRDYVPYLEKGEMIIYHPLYVSPFPVLFPIPLHEVVQED